jgi:hypothetical protein
VSQNGKRIVQVCARKVKKGHSQDGLNMNMSASTPVIHLESGKERLQARAKNIGKQHCSGGMPANASMLELLETRNATHKTRVNCPNSSNAEELDADVDSPCDTTELSQRGGETENEMPLHPSRE